MAKLDPNLANDLRVVFDTEPGERVLEWFRGLCGEGETLTVEEKEKRPIDTTSFFLREGMRRAYRRLDLMVREAKGEQQ